MTLRETSIWLSEKSLDDKGLFYELLLSDFTVMNRALWSSPITTDGEKLDCLKWSNELSHRVFNLLFELKRGDDNNSEVRLIENINYYRKQSYELSEHLAATLTATVKRYKQLKG
ncbi:MAG: hypothetical protein ACPGLV_04660 [Bacteroidia bacterium]